MGQANGPMINPMKSISRNEMKKAATEAQRYNLGSCFVPVLTMSSRAAVTTLKRKFSRYSQFAIVSIRLDCPTGNRTPSMRWIIPLPATGWSATTTRLPLAISFCKEEGLKLLNPA